METSEQIQTFTEFLEQNYKSQIFEQISNGKKYQEIDFNELSKYSPTLAEDLLDNPEELIKVAEIATEQFDIDKNIKGFVLRFYNLPKTQQIDIRNIRSAHLGKLLQVKGIVRQKSDVRPQVTSAKFECPSCGNVIPVLQLEQKFKEPSGCGCGRKGKFRLISKELVDAQKIVIEESIDEISNNSQPKRLNIFLKNDLTSPISDQRTNPGSKIMVTGVLNEVPIPSKDGGKLTLFDIMLETNYIKPLEEDFSNINISPEDEKEIKEISKRKDLIKFLVDNLAPTVYGYDKVKEAILYQLMKGVQKHPAKGNKIRGDMHILLVGDPGSGKSQILKRVGQIAPKSRYSAGQGSTGTGLTASVIKDDFIGGYALEAGALVLSNKGMCMLDELDKMSKEDTSALHEGLEQQSISIHKANIHATLSCETSVLAAANPKFERFDAYETIAKQITLPSTLINRFDLIFIIKDLPNKEKDDKLADHILNQHQGKKVEKDIALTDDLFRKYISYARQITPELTDEALFEIKNYFNKMRQSSYEGEKLVAISISARQLEGLIRLTEASAKVRLSNKALKEDAKKAIELMHHSLSEIGLDPKTGRIDMDRISSSVTQSDRNIIGIVKGLINTLEEEHPSKQVPYEELLEKARSNEITQEILDQTIEKLKKTGDLFEPKRGYLKKI